MEYKKETNSPDMGIFWVPWTIVNDVEIITAPFAPNEVIISGRYEVLDGTIPIKEKNT